MKTSTRFLLAALTLALSVGAAAPTTVQAAECEASIANGSAFRGMVRRELKKKGYRIANDDESQVEVSVAYDRPTFIEAWLRLDGYRLTVEIELDGTELKGGAAYYDPHKREPKRRDRKAYVSNILAAQIPECR